MGGSDSVADLDIIEPPKTSITPSSFPAQNNMNNSDLLDLLGLDPLPPMLDTGVSSITENNNGGNDILPPIMATNQNFLSEDLFGDSIDNGEFFKLIIAWL